MTKYETYDEIVNMKARELIEAKEEKTKALRSMSANIRRIKAEMVSAIEEREKAKTNPELFEDLELHQDEPADDTLSADEEGYEPTIHLDDDDPEDVEVGEPV